MNPVTQSIPMRTLNAYNSLTGQKIPVDIPVLEMGQNVNTVTEDLYTLTENPKILQRVSDAVDRREISFRQTVPLEKSKPPIPEYAFAGFEMGTFDSTIFTQPMVDSARYMAGLTRDQLQRFSDWFESIFIDPAIPYVKKFSTFWTVASQEFLSFAFMSPAVTSLIAYLVANPQSNDPMTWYQYALIGIMSLTFTPLLVQGVKDGFSNEEKWDQYFVKEAGELIKDSEGHLVADLDKWGNHSKIVAHSFYNGGLVRMAKVVSALYPKDIPALKNINFDLMPKTKGEWVNFSLELTTDIALYLAYFGIDAMNDANGIKGFGWDTALIVTAISVIAYCFTAPEIGKKFSKYKATWIRQVFSIFKNPAVMLAGSGVFSDQASIAMISVFSLGLWTWAKYGFKGEEEFLQYMDK